MMKIIFQFYETNLNSVKGNVSDLPEGESGEWTVRLMAVDVTHGGAPEVIAEHMAERAEP